jgi:hypothetical protein
MTPKTPVQPMEVEELLEAVRKGGYNDCVRDNELEGSERLDGFLDTDVALQRLNTLLQSQLTAQAAAFEREKAKQMAIVLRQLGGRLEIRRRHMVEVQPGDMISTYELPDGTWVFTLNANGSNQQQGEQS